MSGPVKLVPDLEERLKALPPEQRAEAEQYLSDYYSSLEANPLLRFDPHPKQAAFLGIKTQIGAVFAGNRFGKTAVGVVDDLIQCCDRDAVPEHLRQFKRWDPEEHGPIKGRICAPKFNENIGQVIIPAIRDWAPKSQLRGGSFDDAYSKSERILYFANGSTIQFLTFDQDRDAHAGAARHFVHFDEEPEGEKGLGLFIENMTRLGDYDGDFRITMTPLFGLSWTYEVIFERYLEDSRISVIQGGSYENPHVNRERLRMDAQMMTKEERQSLREGKFVHFAGQFYPEFGERHQVPNPTAKHVNDQDIIVGIDPGLNYTGLVWVAFDNDNVALLFEERKPEQVTVAEAAQVIKDVNKQWGIDPDYYVIDPSARNRSTVNAEAIENAYLREGIPTIHGQNDRAAGILEVKRRLQYGPGLFVSESCPLIAKEFRRYRKDPNSSDEFAAVKKDDHCFPAGTMIATETGERPIETIAPGDLVWTRSGLYPVLDAGLTQEDAAVRELRFSDGRSLIGTSSHPVYVGGEEEWVSLGSVRYGDILYTCPEGVTASSNVRKSSGTASSSIAIQTHQAPARASISPPRRFAYTALYGKLQTGQSPRGSMSTTSTGTRVITSCPTWNSSEPVNINGGTWTQSGGSKRGSTCAASSLLQRLGTRLKRGRLFTESKAARSLLPSPSAISPARFVGRPSRAAVTKLVSASPSVAPLTGAERGSTTSSGLARSAVASSPPTSTPSNALVPVRVAANLPAGRSAVYNLTVDGPSEYFANSVLVHNCLDALRYVLMERVWTVEDGSPSPDLEPWQPGDHVDADWLEAERGESNGHPLSNLV